MKRKHSGPWAKGRRGYLRRRLRRFVLSLKFATLEGHYDHSL